MPESDLRGMMSQAQINLLPYATTVVAGGQGSPLMAGLEVRVLSGNAEKVLIDYWHPLHCSMYPAGMRVCIFRGQLDAGCFVCSHPQGRLYVAYSKEQPTLI
jgi:hypothetical protein